MRTWIIRTRSESTMRTDMPSSSKTMMASSRISFISFKTFLNAGTLILALIIGIHSPSIHNPHKGGYRLCMICGKKHTPSLFLLCYQVFDVIAGVYVRDTMQTDDGIE